MKNDDEDEVTDKSSVISVEAALSKLKKKVLSVRAVDVTERMLSNSAKLRNYTSRLHDSTKEWSDNSSLEDIRLSFQNQKAQRNLTSTESGIDSRDDGLAAATSIISGPNSGGKSSLKPVKLRSQPNVPPYTTWIFLDRKNRRSPENLVDDFTAEPSVLELAPFFSASETSLGLSIAQLKTQHGANDNDEAVLALVQTFFSCELGIRLICFSDKIHVLTRRNQRMAEDQSVQGRRRIYYDPIGNETLIASDSEEEEPGEEEQKHDFSRGEDFIIWTAVREKGSSYLVFDQISQCLRVNREEIKARYEVLVNDQNKQANCEALGAGIRSRLPPSPSSSVRRKAGNDFVYFDVKDGQTSRINEPMRRASNSPKQNFDVEKAEAKDLVAAMDSFDNLFCRRCLVFDCRLHGCSQPLVHPSERQAVCPSESSSPCSAQCYLLSPRMRGEKASSSLPGSSRAKDVRSIEGAEWSRTAKRQKTQEIVTHKVVHKLSSSDAVVAGIETAVTISEAKTSNLECITKPSERNEDKSGTEAPVISVIESQCTKKEMHTVASRLTSHKKLARTSKKLIKENQASDGGDSNIFQRPDVIESNRVEGLFKVENAELGRKSGGEMNGAALQCSTISDDHQVEHVCKEVYMGEVVLHHEKTRFLSTKRLARSAKRALEEFKTDLQSSSIAAPLQSHIAKVLLNGTNGMGAGVDTIGSQDVGVAKLTESNVENLIELPAVAICVSPDRQQTAGDRLGDKCKVTSPKKLARSARKPIPAAVGGNIDGKITPSSVETATKLILEERCVKEAKLADGEKPFRDDKSRNTAAKKLARSSRKAFAEKVAEAIQHQQLHSQIDSSKRRVGKESSREERIYGSVFKYGDSNVEDVVDLTGDDIPKTASTYDPEQEMGNGERYSEVKAKEVHSKPDQKPKEASTSKREDELKRMETRDNWTAFEKGLLEKGLQMFGRNSCMVTRNMLVGCKTCAEVGEYMYAQDVAAARGESSVHQFPDSLAYVSKWDVARARARLYGRRKGSRKLKFTLKSAGQSAIRKRMVNGKDAPCRQYTPCGCLFTCGKQCPCQLSGTCCEKYCGCAKSCKNRFRGCHCAKSQCCSRQCPCFAAGRECDPDVCRNCWIGCGDGTKKGPPQKEDKENYQCHNMKLLLKQQQRVLLSRSDVAGWGAFVKKTVGKHDYLGEYTGELISHREADKRGKIYDRENSSFLFNLNDQYVLDACRKGDKLKFANHSPNPNCYAKVIMVAGDHRVGIFAKERILAGEELFYDYRYEAERAPVWAKKGDDQGKKDDSGPSERRSKQAS